MSEVNPSKEKKCLFVKQSVPIELLRNQLFNYLHFSNILINNTIFTPKSLIIMTDD